MCHEGTAKSTVAACATQKNRQNMNGQNRGRLRRRGANARLRPGLRRRWSGSLSLPGPERSQMTEEEERELREALARLMQEHRDLDAAIEALENAPGRDRLQIQRLKKRKLHLRDRITFIEDQLTPDIIA